jgi:hypothetical protein
MKGTYLYKGTKAVREHNLNLIKQGEWTGWVQNMVYEIKRSNTSGYFRWHDSGDVQSIEHLKAIAEIAKQMSGIKFWLPTLEKGILNKAMRQGLEIPENLTIRLSTAMVNGEPSKAWATTSTVTTKKDMRVEGVLCKSYEQEGKCLTCRACWDKTVKNVTYLKH